MVVINITGTLKGQEISLLHRKLDTKHSTRQVSLHCIARERMSRLSRQRHCLVNPDANIMYQNVETAVEYSEITSSVLYHGQYWFPRKRLASRTHPGDTSRRFTAFYLRSNIYSQMGYSIKFLEKAEKQKNCIWPVLKFRFASDVALKLNNGQHFWADKNKY